MSFHFAFLSWHYYVILGSYNGWLTTLESTTFTFNIETWNTTCMFITALRPAEQRRGVFLSLFLKHFLNCFVKRLLSCIQRILETTHLLLINCWFPLRSSQVQKSIHCELWRFISQITEQKYLYSKLDTNYLLDGPYHGRKLRLPTPYAQSLQGVSVISIPSHYRLVAQLQQRYWLGFYWCLWVKSLVVLLKSTINQR